MSEDNLLGKYDFQELGQIYIKTYRDYVDAKKMGFGLGFGDLSKRTEELENKKDRLEIVTEEFSSRPFKERVVVYRAFLSAVVDFEDEGDYEAAIEFGKMAEEFYRRILD